MSGWGCAWRGGSTARRRNRGVCSILSNCRARQAKSDRNRTLKEAQCDWANVFVGNSGGAMAYGAKISGVDRGMRQP
ncbi:hypothetical protein [Xanthomonas campestris]|uniref:hypothetical protein n=1 Tax=Xanthomonas campestris TaxID=339 RepID=UPI003CCFE319